MAQLFPLFLQLTGRRVLVVGAGVVGQRKVDELLEAAADVVVVAPQATPHVHELAAQGAIFLRLRPFHPDDVNDVWLVIAATELPDVNRQVWDAANARRIFVNAVDDPPHASCFFASIVRRAPFTIAISSTGEAPALARLLREILQAILPEERWILEARALRRRWRSEATPMASRFEQLVRSFAATMGPPAPPPG